MTVKQVDRVSVLEFERSLEQILENEPVKLTKQEEAAVRMAVKHELKKTGSGMEYLDHWIKKDTVKRQEIGIPMEEARTYSSMRNKYKREYALGFIKGLSEKFEEQKANSELSLVVVNPNVKEYLNGINFSGVHRSRTSYITNTYCYEKGKYNGKNLADIDTQMEGVTKK